MQRDVNMTHRCGGSFSPSICDGLLWERLLDGSRWAKSYTCGHSHELAEYIRTLVSTQGRVDHHGACADDDSLRLLNLLLSPGPEALQECLSLYEKHRKAAGLGPECGSEGEDSSRASEEQSENDEEDQERLSERLAIRFGLLLSALARNAMPSNDSELGFLEPSFLPLALPCNAAQTLTATHAYFSACALPETLITDHDADSSGTILSLAGTLWENVPVPREEGSAHTKAKDYARLVSSSWSETFADIKGTNLPTGLTVRRLGSILVNDMLLARRYRILQWEIMPRNLLAEENKREAEYLFASEEKGIYGRVSPHLHKQLLMAGWQVHARGTIPFAHGNQIVQENQNCRSTLPNDLSGRTDEEYRAFNLVARKLHAFAKRAHQDILETIVEFRKDRMRDTGNPVGNAVDESILVEDGEFTFYTLLWLFRRAKNVAIDIRQWFNSAASSNAPDCGPCRKPLDPLPRILAEGGISWWQDASVEELLFSLGLVAPVEPRVAGENVKYRVTPRWLSFVRWLIRERAAILAIKQDLNESPGQDEWQKIEPYISVLPIKRMRRLRSQNEYKPYRTWIVALIEFFASPELDEYLYGVSAPGTREPDPQSAPLLQRLEFDSLKDFVSRCLEPRSKWFGVLTNNPPSYSQKADEGPYQDDLVHRLCRAPYLPLEFMLRRSQPYEMQLLILPLNFTPTSWLLEGKGESPAKSDAPVSLCYTTIAGSLPVGGDEAMRRHSLMETEEPSQVMRHHRDRVMHRSLEWLAPYWNLLGHMNSEVMAVSFPQQAKRVGIQNTIRNTMHETRKLLRFLTWPKQWLRPVDDIKKYLSPKYQALLKDDAEVNGKEIWDKELLKSLNVVPFAEYFHAAGAHIYSWFGSYEIDDLPFGGKIVSNEIPCQSVEALFRVCQEHLFAMFLAVGIYDEMPNLFSEDTSFETRARNSIAAAQQLFNLLSEATLLDIPSDKRPELTWGNAEAHAELIALARLFMCLAREDVQYANPLHRPEVTVIYDESRVSFKKVTHIRPDPSTFRTEAGTFLEAKIHSSLTSWQRAGVDPLKTYFKAIARWGKHAESFGLGYKVAFDIGAPLGITNLHHGESKTDPEKYEVSFECRFPGSNLR